MRFVAIDFETANSKRSSVCAVGLAQVDNGVLLMQKKWFVRPSELYFDPFNVWIHGITEDDVRDQPEFNDLWPLVLEAIQEGPLVAHNASFDMSVLRHVLDWYGIAFPSVEYFCTRVIAKKAWPKLYSYRLSTVAEFPAASTGRVHV